MSVRRRFPAPIRVAVPATHPIQYQSPLWRKVAATPGFQARVFYGADFSVRGYRDREFGTDFAWDVPLLERYRWEFLPGSGRCRAVSFFSPPAVPVFRALLGWRPKVVVLGAYHGVFWHGAWLAARIGGASLVIRHEATDEAHTAHPGKKFLRALFLRLFYSGNVTFAVTGRPARRHLEGFGISPSRLHESPYCVDTEMWGRQIRRLAPRRAALRQGLGVGKNGLVILFSGKLIEKKNPRLILEATARLPPPLRKKTHVVFAGSGALEPSLRNAKGIPPERMHFLGFLNQSRLGEAYAMADLLILPSKRGAGETWGLVVNEALQWGIPALVSEGVGCREDLISPGQTGLVFPDGDSQSLTRCILRMARLLETNQSVVREACRQKARAFSLQAAHRGLRNAILAAAQLPK